MKKFFLVVIAIELVLMIAAVDYLTAQAQEANTKLERIASELEYLSDRG